MKDVDCFNTNKIYDTRGKEINNLRRLMEVDRRPKVTDALVQRNKSDIDSRIGWNIPKDD